MSKRKNSRNSRNSRRRRGRGRRLGWLIAVLVLALGVVAGVIIWKQLEYGASADYYEGLREIGRLAGGKIA